MTSDPMGEARAAARMWLKENDPDYALESDQKSPPVVGGRWVSLAVLALLALAAGLVFFRTDTPVPSMRADGPSISTPLPAISDVK